MSIPQVAIVGRPNVGKSSLLNWLAGARIAVVDDRPGVTRDRLAHLVSHEERYFELIDTGGMGIDDVDNLTEHITQQIEIAIEAADLILFVVDTRTGRVPLDENVAQRLRRVNAPVICVANKTDNDHLDLQIEEFRTLGFTPLVAVSTRENRGRDELLETILQQLPHHLAADQADLAEPEMKVAIVGRRNVGKSTFINTLCQEERMIVSEIPGTTRDSVDVRFEMDGKAFIGIDTPGMRRTKSIQNDVEYYGMHRAMRSIRRADVVFLFFDCAEPISKVDKQLCEYIVEQYKPCMFVVNKWDQYAGGVDTEKWVEYLGDTFRTMRYAPIAFITGKTGKNVKALLNHGQMLFKQARSRATTGQLNRIVRRALEKNPPPLYKHRTPKIYFATQVAVQPPTIVLFCNLPEAISKPYQRYLLGVLHDELEAQEIPIKLYFRKREQNEEQEGEDLEQSLNAENEAFDAQQ